MVREVEFAHGTTTFGISLPQSAEDLLDEEAFAKDECMPYWADLWPSARALARWILDQPHIEGNWLELGCGVGVPSLALKSRGGDVLATDHNDDALLFARANSWRNGLGDLHTALLDWRDRKIQIGTFANVIAADVLYEQRTATALLDLLPRVVGPRGRFILADPGRRWAGEFRRGMHAAGWHETELDLLDEPPIGAAAPSLVQIAQWTPRAPA